MMANYEFKYTAAGTAAGVKAGPTALGDLEKLTKIADFTDADSGVRFFHDGNGTLYYVMLDAEQQVIAADGQADLRVAREGLELNDGDVCSIFSEGATLQISYPGHERESLGSDFSLDNGDVQVLDAGETKAAPESESAAETEAEDTETAGTEPAEESAAEESEDMPVDAADLMGAATEAPNLIATAAPAQEDAQEEIVTEAVTEIPAAVPEGGGNGVLVWAICATAAAVGLGVLCAYFAKKVGDSTKSRKLKDTELKSLQRSVEDKTTAYTKGQERIRELENQLADAHAQVDDLRDQAKTSAAAAASELERLESRPSEEAFEEANQRADKLQQEYDALYVKARTLMRENEQYAARIRELEQGAPAAAAPAGNAAAASETAAPGTGAAQDAGPDAFRISTSEEELAKYSDQVFAAPASTMTAEDTVLNKAPFRRASLVVLGGRAYLNPYFFRALSEGMENYTNLAGLGGVFEMEGLGSSAVKYRLSEIVPANVSYDAATDSYHVVQRGKLVLRIG